MPYTQLLNKLIDDSKLSANQIADKCKEYGVKITPSYISTLRNDKNNRTPSDDVSVAIAKACNVPNGYENVLVIEAYLDIAPKEIKKLIEMMKDVFTKSVIGAFENKATTQQMKEIRKQYDNMPMAHFLIAYTSEEAISTIKKQAGTLNIESKDFFKDTNITITQEIKPVGFSISDNGMYPIISKGDMVNVEIREYKTGDIVLLKKKDKKANLLARKVVVGNKKQITLIPINNEFLPETVSVDDIIILGVVTQFIRQI